MVSYFYPRALLTAQRDVHIRPRQKRAVMTMSNQGITLGIADCFEWSPEKRCPYGTIRDVFGPSTVSALLEYVGGRQAAFRPGLIRSRLTGQRRITPSLRDSLFAADVGPFRPQMERVMREIAPVALAHFGLIEPAVEPREFEFACYGDGSYFKNFTSIPSSGSSACASSPASTIFPRCRRVLPVASCGSTAFPIRCGGRLDRRWILCPNPTSW